MPYKIAKSLPLFILIICLTNCAAIIHGSKQDVVIISDPKRADVEVDGFNVGITPFVARLKRQNNHIVKVSMYGYGTYEIVLKRKLDGWIAGNIIIGGLIGIAIDAATGSMYKLTPKDVDAELKSKPNAFNKNKDEIYLTVVLKPNANWTKISELQKIK